MSETKLTDSLIRMGVICFRLAMILTAIRSFENRNVIEECSDQDFQTALTICNILLQHTSVAYDFLLRNPYKRHDPFYIALPSNFKTREAVAIGEDLNMDKRTVARRLADYNKQGDLSQAKKGSYFKGLQSTENITKII